MCSNLVAAILPALDEEQAITQVVAQLGELRTPTGEPAIDHILVVDNGSVDQTVDHAKEAGAEVIFEPLRGYGSACWAGARKAKALGCRTYLFVDADGSAEISESIALLTAINDGADLSVGVRVAGRESLSAIQRLGNELASMLIWLLFRSKVSDFGPFRAITAEAFDRIGMRDRAFGWTVEMQVRAIQLNLETVELPVTVKPRIGQSKISGTVSGVIGAGKGIIGTILKLWWRGGPIPRKNSTPN